MTASSGAARSTANQSAHAATSRADAAATWAEDPATPRSACGRHSGPGDRSARPPCQTHDPTPALPAGRTEEAVVEVPLLTAVRRPPARGDAKPELI